MTVAADGPVVVNAGGWGYFRVAYDAALQQRVVAGLATLNELERFNLASDAWAATLAGFADVDSTLDLLAAYKDETNPSTWGLLLEIGAVLSRVVGDAAAPFLRDLAGPAAGRLGWDPADGEGETVGMVRGYVLEILGTHGHDETTAAEARRRVDAAANGDTTALTGDIRRAALQTVGAAADEAAFTTLLNGMRNAATPQEEQQYRFALTAVRHEALVRRVADLCLSELRSQDVSFVILYLTQGGHPEVVWDWLETHWDELMAKLPHNLQSRMLGGIPTITSGELASRVRAFLDAHPLESGAKTVAQYMEMMDGTVAFADRARAALLARFGS
jgi:puromycin-sensitive aminopeptidase